MKRERLEELNFLNEQITKFEKLEKCLHSKDGKIIFEVIRTNDDGATLDVFEINNVSPGLAKETAQYLKIAIGQKLESLRELFLKA